MSTATKNRPAPVISAAQRISTMTPASWPDLEFTDTGAERLQEVKHFLLEELPLMDGATPEVVEAIRKEFLERMDYLNGYGDDRYRVSLGRDWAPYSFSLAWMRKVEGAYRFAFNGGLIFHGAGETFTVSLTRQWWGVHT